jgi:MFS family permease
MERPQYPEPAIIKVSEELKDNPIQSLDLSELRVFITHLYEAKFDGKDSVTFDELWIGAKIAKNFGNHSPPDVEDRIPPERSAEPSITSANGLLDTREWKAITVQQSLSFWQEPKDLLVTLAACCVASLTQGWDQVANGNLGWPLTLGLSVQTDGTAGKDIWTFAAANAITWFSAAILGPFLVDPICHSKFFGRRGAVFLAASFSFASMIGCSQAQSWQGYLISRLFLGIGIGAKASIVPIWESEILPQAKRGRLLVSWQVFTATGIFAGSVATYIFRNNWRNQVLTGALPALILLILTFLCCESPRWLILQGEYLKAFDTLVRLRKERILAAEELCYIHFQIQTERALLRRNNELNSKRLEDRIGYSDRLSKLATIARNRRAAVASMIVMLSQQLSGINILGFLASIFFSSAGLSNTSNGNDSLRLAIGFGAANAVFSAIAYFLIEPLEDEDPFAEAAASTKRQKRRKVSWMLGRRSLLLMSLAGGSLMLFILALLLDLKSDNPAKLPLVVIFIMLFTLFYSPGAGCVPFLYSAEVWPNEGREVGMSWAVFWNFLGAGFLSLFVPRCLQWGTSKLFGLFTGLSMIGFFLVYLFVPATDHAISIEEMSAKFDTPLLTYCKRQILYLLGSFKLGKKTGNTKEATAHLAGGLPVLVDESKPEGTGAGEDALSGLAEKTETTVTNSGVREVVSGLAEKTETTVTNSGVREVVSGLVEKTETKVTNSGVGEVVSGLVEKTETKVTNSGAE